MDREGGTFQRFLGPDSGQPAYVSSLLQDHRGRLLAGTVQGGVLTLEPGATEFSPLALTGVDVRPARRGDRVRHL